MLEGEGTTEAWVEEAGDKGLCEQGSAGGHAGKAGKVPGDPPVRGR